jgi:UDP-3-O-[3-hydroxymyristoyl] glucosamine N-acyltransferase
VSTSPRPLGELARHCGGELRNARGDELVTGVAPLDTATRQQISFFSNAAYRDQLARCEAVAILVAPTDLEQPALQGRALVVVSNPYVAFAKLATLFQGLRPAAPGIDPLAKVEEGATVDASARVEAFAHVVAGAAVGPRARIMSGAYVGADARVGADTVLYPRVVIREGCLVGERCILHPGVVIGADGFGFAFDFEGEGEGPMHRKIPQVGIARIEDDVEIGANSCVDRATFGETVVGRGSKLDNMVQIAHNVVLGPLCVIAAQAGVAGSTTLGAGVVMGGQVGIAGHLHIGDMARIGAKAGVGQDVEAGTTASGWPSMDHKVWLRAVTMFPRLPELFREVRDLKRKRAKSDDDGKPSP